MSDWAGKTDQGEQERSDAPEGRLRNLHVRGCLGRALSEAQPRVLARWWGKGPFSGPDSERGAHHEAALDEARQEAQRGVLQAIRQRAEVEARDVAHQHRVRHAARARRCEERYAQRHCLLVIPPQKLRSALILSRPQQETRSKGRTTLRSAGASFLFCHSSCAAEFRAFLLVPVMLCPAAALALQQGGTASCVLALATSLTRYDVSVRLCHVEGGKSNLQMQITTLQSANILPSTTSTNCWQ